MQFQSITTSFLRFFFLFAILAVAIAAPGVSKTTTAAPAPTCASGAVQCCDSVESANSNVVIALLELLGIALGSVTGQVGVTCSPITGVGLSGTSCTSQTVCCNNDSFNGIIAIGCTPINLNL